MYGLGSGPSKISAARSLADHRGDRAELLATLDVVEALEVLRPPRVGEQRALTERAGPVLAAALEPGDDAVVGERLGHRLGDVGRALVVDAAARSHASSSSSSQTGRGPRWPSARPGRRGRRRRAARRPRAVPVSPEAGWTQTASNGPSRQIREFATQLSATPPAIVRVALAGAGRAASARARAGPPRGGAGPSGEVGVGVGPAAPPGRGGANAAQSTGATVKPPSPVVRTRSRKRAEVARASRRTPSP